MAAENFGQSLRENNKTVMDIVQQGITMGVIRLDSETVKKAVYNIIQDLLVDGSGVTITFDDSANTITITAP